MENKIKSFTDLDAWQKGHILVLNIYRISKDFPAEEKFDITNQIRRSAVSITSNIAEGFSRSSYKDKMQFFIIALGSLTELQNQLIITRYINYLKTNDFMKLADITVTISKIINGLIKKCKKVIHNT